jgi:methylated-DNA-protein-cysteine methyltransferase related protein
MRWTPEGCIVLVISLEESARGGNIVDARNRPVGQAARGCATYYLRCKIEGSRLALARPERVPERESGDSSIMSWEPVYRLIKAIPRGQVTTYGEIARALKLAGGARAVGYAMAACPNGRGIPWHRVVGAGGRLLIPEPHGSLQRRLLETEGVEIEGLRLDIARYAWSPQKKRRRLPAARKRMRAKRR